MRKFSVTVNGTTYEVEIEEVTGSETVSTAATAPKAAPAPAPKAAAPKATAAAGTTAVKSPFPWNDSEGKCFCRTGREERRCADGH